MHYSTVRSLFPFSFNLVLLFSCSVLGVFAGVPPLWHENSKPELPYVNHRVYFPEEGDKSYVRVRRLPPVYDTPFAPVDLRRTCSYTPRGGLQDSEDYPKPGCRSCEVICRDQSYKSCLNACPNYISQTYLSRDKMLAEGIAGENLGECVVESIRHIRSQFSESSSDIHVPRLIANLESSFYVVGDLESRFNSTRNPNSNLELYSEYNIARFACLNAFANLLISHAYTLADYEFFIDDREQKNYGQCVNHLKNIIPVRGAKTPQYLDGHDLYSSKIRRLKKMMGTSSVAESFKNLKKQACRAAFPYTSYELRKKPDVLVCDNLEGFRFSGRVEAQCEHSSCDDVKPMEIYSIQASHQNLSSYMEPPSPYIAPDSYGHFFGGFKTYLDGNKTLVDREGEVVIFCRSIPDSRYPEISIAFVNGADLGINDPAGRRKYYANGSYQANQNNRLEYNLKIDPPLEQSATLEFRLTPWRGK